MKVNENVKEIIIKNAETGEEFRIANVKHIESKDILISDSAVQWLLMTDKEFCDMANELDILCPNPEKAGEALREITERIIEAGESVKETFDSVRNSMLNVSGSFSSLQSALQEANKTWEKKEKQLLEEKKRCECYMRKQQIERELNVIRFNRKREKRRMEQNGNKKH